MLLINCSCNYEAVTLKHHNIYAFACVPVLLLVKLQYLTYYRILVTLYSTWHKCRIYYCEYILFHDSVRKLIICINILYSKTLYGILITVLSSLNKSLSGEFFLLITWSLFLFSYRKHNNSAKRQSCKSNLFILNR